MTQANLTFELSDDGVAVLSLHNPPLNVLETDLWYELDRLTSGLHDDQSTRVVIVTGGPRHFAAGANVAELVEMTPTEFRTNNLILQRALNQLAKAPQVVIAAVNGYALGGGCELALAADFRFAAEDATFGLPEVTLGIIPGSGGTQRLQRVVGVSIAKDLIFTGRRVTAEEALRIGLVDRLIPPKEVLNEALAYGAEFASGPFALGMAKRAIDVGGALPIDQGLALEAELIVQCFASEDGQSGLRSFLDKGPGKATFSGR